MIAIQSGADLTGVKEGALKFWQQAARAQWYEVAGSSMWPFLLSGDSVLIQPNVERLQIGDVALLRCGERLLIHRITQINQDGSVIAWGDFNLQPDPTVMPEQIIGIAKTIKRKDQQIPIRSCRKVWGQTVIQLRPLLILNAKIVRKLIWLIKIKKRVNHEN